MTTAGAAASTDEGPGRQELRRRLERIGAEVRAAGVVREERPLVELARPRAELQA